MLNERSVIYIVGKDIPEIGGVYYKVKGLMDTFARFGYQTEILTNRSNSKRNTFKLYARIVKTRSKHILIRGLHGWLFMFIVPYLILARMQGKRLILDVPTPFQAAVYEILNRDNIGKFKKCKHIIYHYLGYPFITWFVNVVIQNGDESPYFMFGAKKKTLFLGNGIDPNRMALREKRYTWPSGELNLVGVADVNIYHGFDRVIKAVGKWNNDQEREFKVRFHIIGGRSRPELITALKQLAEHCGVEAYIVFHGPQYHDYVYDFYSTCHLAVGSLGLFRIHLQSSSVLKVREYCLAGIPFIAAGDDPDFSGDIPFRFEVSNNENPDDLLRVFETFSARRNLFSDEDIREYAIEHCSFESKAEKLGFINLNSNMASA